MTMIAAIYLWAAFGTGLVISRTYGANEKKRIIGPIALGLLWPVFLPIASIAVAGPPWRNPAQIEGWRKPRTPL